MAQVRTDSGGKPTEIAGSGEQHPASVGLGLDSETESYQPEPRNLYQSGPRPAVSTMWASSVLWAAEGLADFVTSTFRNVTSASPMTAGSRCINGWRRVSE